MIAMFLPNYLVWIVGLAGVVLLLAFVLTLKSWVNTHQALFIEKYNMLQVYASSLSQAGETHNCFIACLCIDSEIMSEHSLGSFYWGSISCYGWMFPLSHKLVGPIASRSHQLWDERNIHRNKVHFLLFIAFCFVPQGYLSQHSMPFYCLLFCS